MQLRANLGINRHAISNNQTLNDIKSIYPLQILITTYHAFSITASNILFSRRINIRRSICAFYFIEYTSALNVRGGAGPLDVKTTAKVATTIFGIQGAYGTLAPSKENELYGLTGDDDILNWLAEGNSSILLCLAIMAYSIFFKDIEPMKTVGIGLIANVVINAKCLLNEEPKKLGIPAITHQLNLIIN